jgi:hypothetical protein
MARHALAYQAGGSNRAAIEPPVARADPLLSVIIPAYNEAAGGPLAGHAYLVDSNIDRGQDLLRLRDWLRSHPEARPLHLAYFNSVAPQLFGIDYRLPPMGPPRGPVSDGSDIHSPHGPQPGYRAISVSFLRRMTHAVRTGGGRFGIPVAPRCVYLLPAIPPDRAPGTRSTSIGSPRPKPTTPGVGWDCRHWGRTQSRTE